jgi:hypothetical protein
VHGYITTKLRSTHIVRPISLVRTHQIPQVLVQDSIHTLRFPTVWKWKAILNLSFFPTFLAKCIQNAFVNFGSWSDTIPLGNPWCLHQPLRIGYVVSNAVAVSTIGTMCANLANRTTITKMASHPCDSGKFVLKSMHILCHGPGGIGPIAIGRLAFDKRFNLLGIHPSLHKVGYIILYTRPKLPSWNHSIVIFHFLWPPMELSYFSMKAHSFNLPYAIYTQLCLYLNNPSTNLTSFSALPLRSSPRSFCASG